MTVASSRSGATRASSALVQAPPVGVGHDGRWNEVAVLEVLVALGLAPAVAGHDVARVEEDVTRVVHRDHTAFGRPMTDLAASR